MSSINTEIYKPLEKLYIKSIYLTVTFHLLHSLLLLSVQHEDIKDFIIDIETVYYCRYNVYTSCMSSPCIAQSICTAETKILYRCVDHFFITPTNAHYIHFKTLKSHIKILNSRSYIFWSHFKPSSGSS
jgi:hypothetical protein